jgi:putative transposase
MGKGRRNEVLKLTPAKVKYIIRAKSNNISSKMISIEMKVSSRAIYGVWGHWMKNKEALAPGKFGRPKTRLNEADKRLILGIYKEHKSGARRLEIVIEHKYGRHIRHNAIHQVLLENGLANEDKKKERRRKLYIRYEREHRLSAVHFDWHTSKSTAKRFVPSSMIVLDSFWPMENLK